MFCVVSSIFHVLCFPCKWKNVIFDQLAFFSSDSSTNNVPCVGKTNIPYGSVRVGPLKNPALMGTFSIPPTSNIASVNMISSNYDPWIIHSPDQINDFGDAMLLIPVEKDYQTILFTFVDASTTPNRLRFSLDSYLKNHWLGSSDSEDPSN